MSSGKNGDFARLLDDLFQASAGDQPDEDDRAASAPSIPFDYLSVADELHSGRIRVSEADASAKYSAASELIGDILLAQQARANPAPGRTELDPPPLAFEMPVTTDPVDISRELGLAKLTKLEEFARARRAFAFNNHPDRVPAALRERAIARMQVANMLIDQAQSRLKR